LPKQKIITNLKIAPYFCVIVLVSVLSGGAAVSIFGAIVSHILSKRREVETRKRLRQKELTDFLTDWKDKIRTEDASNLPFVYNRELPHLQAKAAAVRSDLGEMERAKFNELIGNLSRLTTEQITRSQGQKMPQEVICEPLDALMEFVTTNLTLRSLSKTATT
jgi:uncharacterized protein YfdQ (DUF2303 family)